MWNHTSSGRANWKLLIVRSSQRNLQFNRTLVGRVPAFLGSETGGSAFECFSTFSLTNNSKLGSIHFESLQSGRYLVLKLNIICNLIVFHVPLQSPAHHSLSDRCHNLKSQHCISFTGNISIFVPARSVRNVNGYMEHFCFCLFVCFLFLSPKCFTIFWQSSYSAPFYWLTPSDWHRI